MLTSSRARAGAIITALVAAMTLTLATFASAATLAPFAKTEYYLGKGGTPPTLNELVANPRHYFASNAAYAAVRKQLAMAAGIPNTEAVFQQLSQQGKLRTVACNGDTIETSGLRADGTISWFSRRCYNKEQLIQVERPDGSWVTAVSLGCLNLVWKVITPAPPPMKPASRSWTEYHSTPSVVTNGLYLCGVYIPGVTVLGQTYSTRHQSGFGTSGQGFGIR